MKRLNQLLYRLTIISYWQHNLSVISRVVAFYRRLYTGCEQAEFSRVPLMWSLQWRSKRK
ncbi:MAG TPA: hypothetical protein VNR87_12300 [Flavisolibacter sp.]|nr:hypothetical protein [Flavisolibacter sp.]